MSKDIVGIESSRNVALFQETSIRRTWHQNQWWFVVVDVVSALTDSRDPTQYINRIRLRDKDLAQGWVHFVHPLGIQTEGGVQRVNCSSARAGGTIAGNARRALEAKSGQPVVSASNNLALAPGAAALGGAAFIETQAGELATAVKNKGATRKKVSIAGSKKVKELRGKPGKGAKA